MYAWLVEGVKQREEGENREGREQGEIEGKE